MKKLLFLSLLFVQTMLYGCAACQLMTPSVEVKLHLNIDKQQLKNIHADWVFSESYINSLLLQYDKNRDNRLDKQELLEVKKVMLEYLLPNHMLTEIRVAKDINGEEALIYTPKFQHFFLKSQEGILTLSYDMRTDIALQNNTQLSFIFSDINSFFAFGVRELLIDSKELAYEENLYLFTASILFQDKHAKIQKVEEAKESFQEPKKTHTPKELLQVDAAETSLQTSLLKESIEKVQSLFKSIKDEKNPLTYITLLLFAYLYGLVHALGPGHGKTLVASYFLSNERSYTKALSVSLAIGIVHTFSAFLLTLIIYFGVNSFLSQFMQDSVYLTTKISALIIISIAIYLLYTKYRAYKKLKEAQDAPKFSFSAKPHVATCSCASCKVDANTTDAALIISAGIIPCPGTTTIFIFAISLGLYYAGFLAAIVMSLGMSTIIYISALISVSLRKKSLQKNEKLKKYLEYTSLIIILILGILLLLS